MKGKKHFNKIIILHVRVLKKKIFLDKSTWPNTNLFPTFKSKYVHKRYIHYSEDEILHLNKNKGIRVSQLANQIKSNLIKCSYNKNIFWSSCATCLTSIKLFYFYEYFFATFIKR